MAVFVFHSKFRNLDVQGVKQQFINGQLVTEDPEVAAKLRGKKDVWEVTAKTQKLLADEIKGDEQKATQKRVKKEKKKRTRVPKAPFKGVETVTGAVMSDTKTGVDTNVPPQEKGEAK